MEPSAVANGGSGGNGATGNTSSKSPQGNDGGPSGRRWLLVETGGDTDGSGQGGDEVI